MLAVAAGVPDHFAEPLEQRFQLVAGVLLNSRGRQVAHGCGFRKR